MSRSRSGRPAPPTGPDDAYAQLDATVDPSVDPSAEAAALEAATLYAGTAVVRGRCTARVTATGPPVPPVASRPMVETPTPLQLRMSRSPATSPSRPSCCAPGLRTGLSRGEPVERMLLTGVSLIVAAVPESLPLVVTLSMALAARRMASRHAVVRNLAAVETLGSVTLLATDKTGTLTEGLMAVSSTWQPEGASPESLMRAVVLCNDVGDGVDGGLRHDPTESALLDTAAAAGVDTVGLRAAHRRLAEVPFDSRTKRMTTWHAVPKESPWESDAPDPQASGTHPLATGTAVQAPGTGVLVVSGGARGHAPSRRARRPARAGGRGAGAGEHPGRRWRTRAGRRHRPGRRPTRTRR